MQVCLLRDLAAQRIDHHQPAARALRCANIAHEVKVRDCGVVAPDNVELGGLRRLRADAGDVAIGSRPGFVAHHAAHRAAIEPARAELVKEAKRHAVVGEHAVRAGVIERRHGFPAEPLDHRVHALMDDVERVVPAHALERPGAASTHAP